MIVAAADDVDDEDKADNASNMSADRHVSEDDIHASYSQSSQSTVTAAAPAAAAEPAQSESYSPASDHHQQQQGTSVQLNQPSVDGIRFTWPPVHRVTWPVW